MKSLQDRLDLTVRRLSTAEIGICNITRERDDAVAQLGVAFCNSEDLKRDNDHLLRENEALKQRIAQMEEEAQGEKQRWARREVALKKKVQQKDEAVHEVREITREIRDLRKHAEEDQVHPPKTGKGRYTRDVGPAKEMTEGTGKQSLPHGRNQSVYESGRVEPSVRIDPGHRNATDTTGFRPRRSGLKEGVDTVDQNAPKKRTRKVVVEETIHSDLSDSDASSTGSVERTGYSQHPDKMDHTMQSQASGTGDVTNLSFLDVRTCFRFAG